MARHFTQLALFATVDEAGALHLVNHLGIELGEEPETLLDRLDRGTFKESDIDYDTDRAGSDRDYSEHVRDVDAATPAAI